jgi:hypothetical protein
VHHLIPVTTFPTFSVQILSFASAWGGRLDTLRPCVVYVVRCIAYTDRGSRHMSLSLVNACVLSTNVCKMLHIACKPCANDLGRTTAAFRSNGGRHRDHTSERPLRWRKELRVEVVQDYQARMQSKPVLEGYGARRLATVSPARCPTLFATACRSSRPWLAGRNPSTSERCSLTAFPM